MWDSAEREICRTPHRAPTKVAVTEVKVYSIITVTEVKVYSIVIKII